jgi:hypothetical protein
MTQGRWTGEVQLLHAKSSAPIPIRLEAFRLDDGQIGQLVRIAMIGCPIKEQTRLGETL